MIKANLPWPLLDAFLACTHIAAWHLVNPWENLAFIVPEKHIDENGVEYFHAYFRA